MREREREREREKSERERGRESVRARERQERERERQRERKRGILPSTGGRGGTRTGQISANPRPEKLRDKQNQKNYTN